MKNAPRSMIRLASIAAIVSMTLGSFPDPSAMSNIKTGKGQGHGFKGTRSKKERDARKQSRRMRKGKRR